MWNKVSSILNQKLTRVLINRSDIDMPVERYYTALEGVCVRETYFHSTFLGIIIHYTVEQMIRLRFLIGLVSESTIYNISIYIRIYQPINISFYSN